MDAIHHVQLPGFRITRGIDGLGKEERGRLGIKSLVVHGNSALTKQRKDLATAATYCGREIISTGPSKPNTRMRIEVKGSEYEVTLLGGKRLMRTRTYCISFEATAAATTFCTELGFLLH